MLSLIAPASFAQTSSLTCHDCPGSTLPAFVCFVDELHQQGTGCVGFNNCQKPVVSGPFLEVIDTGGGTFEARLVVDAIAYWNSQADAGPNSKLDLWWTQGSMATHPTTSLCEVNTTDRAYTYLAKTNLTCGEAPYDFGVYSLRATVCPGSSCLRFADVSGMPFRVTAEDLGCKIPRKNDCKECQGCLLGGVGPVSGGPPVGGGEGTGPGARLRHAARGVGGPGLPGTPAWNQTLGRYWSHDYAERIVVDPDESHVWLLTKTAVFREFSHLVGGVYTSVSPSNEYRTLTYTGSGWELAELGGTVHRFGADGRWLETVDRNGNAKVATYDASGVLTSVDFPDGRREDFGYDAVTGKLASITEVGVDGTSSLTWTYTWSGDDLTRIDRPDGTALAFTYADPRHPGFLTSIELQGTAGGVRVERAWEYDERGNVVATWRGDASRTGANAVDLWTLAYDDPALPTTTTVTDPLGVVSTYTMDRDPTSEVPQILSITGDCPGCGLASDTTFTYGDAAHPLRPTRQTDGNGNHTDFTYDAHGQVLTRTEAAGTALERTTTWTYDATYPGLVLTMERESVAGSPNVRKETSVRDAAGNPTARRIQGFEAGTAFTYETATTFSAEGQPTFVDPPGYSTTDQTSFTYDATRGNLLLASRTDPLVGSTTYDYDPFNRQISVTDINAVTTATEYDPLDRITKITEEGATSAGDRVTQHVYDQYGDLQKTVLPAGNEIAYGHDAAGRLVSLERRGSGGTPGERTLWTLDSAGNRTREELQRWDGTAWVTESFTDFVYSSQCHLARVDHPDGTSTEYAFDCNGNLSRMWDAAHPSNGQTAPASQTFLYDALDRLTEVRQPWGGAGGGEVVTSYGFDVQDHLVSVTDSEGNVTTYTYSDRDLLTQEVSPASGTTTHAYNEHGAMVETVDARGIVTTRTVDALDRVTLVDYDDPITPDPPTGFDVTYAYDTAPASCATSFPTGRLSSITRNGASLDFCYDRFGQVLQDGALSYTYDANGNRATIGYPGGVTASYTHDFADRQATLSVTTPAGTTNVITAATWLPSGPLTSLTRGNGTSERRTYTTRYFPASIELDAPQPLAWAYQTDAMGNVTRIERCTGDLELANGTIAGAEQHTSCGGILAGPSLTVTGTGDLTLTAGQRVVLRDGFTVRAGGALRIDVDPAFAAPEVRVYGYQDHQYYLTLADGPWGERDWSYDRIGNRLSETRDRSTTPRQDSYLYEPNATAANTPLLDEIFLGVGGVRDYSWGAAGHLAQVLSGGNQVDLTTDPAGRMSRAARSDGTNVFAEATFTYDGRSFLTTAEDSAAGTRVEPTYSSEGLLMGLAEYTGSTLDRQYSVLYFGGRPAAQWSAAKGAETWNHYTLDHLGTPSAVTDGAGAQVGRPTIDPWGSAELTETSAIVVRLPGQWTSDLWKDAVQGSGGFHDNVYRWYQPATGRYTKPDPLGRSGDPHPYLYGLGNPLSFFDLLGLKVRVCCKSIPATLHASIFVNIRYGANTRDKRHCYFEFGDGATLGFHGPSSVPGVLGAVLCQAQGTIQRVPAGGRGFDQRTDLPTSCGPWSECADDCVTEAAASYPSPGKYCLFGPNSNTFAGSIERQCPVKPPPPSELLNAPGWYDRPPQ